MNEISNFPLQWPTGRVRTKYRATAKFSVRWQNEHGHWCTGKLTIAAALERLRAELRLLRADQVVISTNLRPRLDGLPISKQAEPADPGVAVYFQLRREPMVLSCDRWNRVADNIAAIASHVEAVRGQTRWGVAEDVRQMLVGFRALAAVPQWWQVLGLEEPASNADAIRERVRLLAVEHHPDRGGDARRMAEINEAAATGLRAVSL